MKNRNLLLASALIVLVLTGCASARESVNWEFKTEKVELEPHEERRSTAEYLADPDR